MPFEQGSKVPGGFSTLNGVGQSGTRRRMFVLPAAFRVRI